MKGAGKYYYPISRCYEELGFEKIGSAYYINHLLFKFGEHARGKTLEIYLIEDEEVLRILGLYSTKKVEVYGMIDGQRGWSERYGWKLKGKWVDFCNNIMEKAVEMYEERCRDTVSKMTEKEKKRKQEELEFAKTFEKYFDEE